MVIKDSTNKGASFRGFLASTTQTVLLMALNFVSIPILIKSLGTDLYGIYNGVLQLGFYVALLDFGMQVSIPIKYSRFIDKGDVRFLVSSAVKLSLIFSFLAVIFLLIFLAEVQQWLIPQSELDFSILLLSVCYGAIFQIISRPYLVYFFLKDSKKEYNFIVFLRSLFIAVITLAIATLKPSIDYLAFAYSVGNLIISVVLIMYYFKEHGWNVVNSWSYLPFLIRNGTYLFVNSLAVMIILRSNSLVLLKYLTPASVTIFTTLYFIPNRLNLIFGKLSDFVFPKLSNIYQESHQQFVKIFDGLFTLIIFLATVIGIILHFTLSPFIEFWSGVIVEQSLVDLMLATLLLGISIKPLTVAMNVLGKTRYYTLASVFEAFSNVVISVLLCQKFGISGVLYGTIISSFVFSLLPNIFWTFGSFKTYNTILLIFLVLSLPFLTINFIHVVLIVLVLLFYIFWIKRPLMKDSLSL